MAKVTFPPATIAGFGPPKPTFQDYLVKWMRYHKEFPEQRSGQAAWNALYTVRSVLPYFEADVVRLHDEVAVRKLDPFDREERLDDFLRFVKENWENYEFSAS